MIEAFIFFFCWFWEGGGGRKRWGGGFDVADKVRARMKGGRGEENGEGDVTEWMDGFELSWGDHVLALVGLEFVVELEVLE